MSTLTALARVAAVAAGRAQPIATVRHVHVHERPLVFLPLALAGEANAPLAALVGDDRDAGQLFVVAQPRNRDQCFAFAADIASVVMSYVDSFTDRAETVSVDRGRDSRIRYADAPQVLIANRAGVCFMCLLGRSTRFRRAYGEYAVDPSVPVLGRWLTFFAERAEHPGSCLLLDVVGALTMHWATGQSLVEDQNLAALLGWIAPPAAATATCPGCGTPSARVPGHRLAASRPAGAADLLPDVHYVDSGYVSVGQVLAAVDEHAVVLIGPLPPDTSWQAADPDAFDLTKFTIDRDARYVVCPNGKVSRNWQHAYSRDGLPVRRR